MGTRRGVFTLLATLLISLALLAAPLYNRGSGRTTLLQVNGSGSLIVFLPVAISALGLFSNRLRLLAGCLMLVWVLAGSLSIGLFYLPIVPCLLWPVKPQQNDGNVASIR